MPILAALRIRRLAVLSGRKILTFPSAPLKALSPSKQELA